jgi:hypothetical protein
VLTVNSYESQNCTNFFNAITKNTYECKVGTDDDYDDNTSKDTTTVKSIYGSITSNSRIKSNSHSSSSKSLIKRRNLE